MSFYLLVGVKDKVYFNKAISMLRMGSIRINSVMSKLLMANLRSTLIFSLHTKTFFEKGMFFSPYVYSVDSLFENIG